METLENPPVGLTPPQRLLVFLTAMAVALTRLLAVAESLWDWDEVQFAMAVEEYDVAAHRPHPPGFPVFVAVAKILRLAATSDFRAVQIVTVVAAMALFPLLFFLFHELRFAFAAAWSGALLTMFVPNVWIYGGTAFSDVPSMALTVAACAFLLHGIHRPSSLLLGALLLGLAAGIRPQALLIGAAPSLLAVWKHRRRWRLIVQAMALGAVTLAAAYTGAVVASSSYEGYFETARKLREYLRAVDSFLSPERPPLPVLAEFFFIRAIPGGNYARALLYAAAAGALITAIRRDGRVGLLLLMFLPFQFFAWLMLDYHSVTRYGLTFIPMYALLAAAGVTGLLAWVPGFGRLAGAVVVVVFAVVYARWSVPALTEVRQNPSPPVRAVNWVNEAIPASALVYVHGSMAPYAGYFMGGRQLAAVGAPDAMGSGPPPEDAVVLTELPSPLASARRFVRPRSVLFEIVRQRYFETTVVPARAWADFGEGWHPVEWHGADVWLWMGRSARTLLPAAAGPMTLSLRLEPALEHGPPVIDVVLNGTLLERFALTGPMNKQWTVAARPDGWNELVLTSDRAVNPLQEGLAPDSRDLSLRLLSYDWMPVAR
ncbi:MAG TPA: hypothetical protein VFT12_06750 [Thermoanaerobaculia bacterium]|nr:hypothetical protein [Thermoanaerobaculia bacterium]